MLTGMMLTGVNTFIPKNHYVHFEQEEKKQYVSVIIKEQNNSNEKNRKYTAEVKEISHKNTIIRSSGNILLLVDKSRFSPVFTLGNEYKLLVKIQKPFVMLNPHQFDYGKYLERKYILRTGKVEKILSEQKHSSFWYSIKNFNQKLIRKVDNSVLKENSKEFLKAFLLGDRSEMKRDTIEAYSKSGIMHLIAISGMHIAFIFGIIFKLFSIFLGRKNRKITILVSLLFVWAFGCFVGLSSSVSRSCLMITLYYAFELLKRPSNIYHSLSLSAVIILLCDPHEIYSIGFQLSYAAVFFMSWLGASVMKYIKVKNKKVNTWIMEPLSMTLVAQLGTLPLVLYYFHQISLLSVPANIFIIPYTVVITYASILELLGIFLPHEYQFYFSSLYDYLVMMLVEASRWISSVDFFLFRNISLNLPELTFLCFFVVFLRYFLKKPALRTAFPFLLCLFVFQVSRLVQDYKFSDKKNFIVFHDKTVLLGFREGEKLVVVKDPTSDMKRLRSYIIDPYITQERIRKVEYKDINYQEMYQWRSHTISVSGKDKMMIPDSEGYDHVIVSGKHRINLMKNGVDKDISPKSGISYADKADKNPDSLWFTAKKGAFIVSL
jgi:competence protein ComEC